MSNNLSLQQLTTGQTNKEGGVNTATGQLDAAITEIFTIDLTSGNATPTAANVKGAFKFQAQNATVAGRTVTFAAVKRGLVVLEADSTCTQAVAFKVGTGTVTVPPSTVQLAYMDGTTNGLRTAFSAATNVASLTDVNLTSLADKQELRYDAASGKWVNADRWAISTKTADYTLALADYSSVIQMNKATAINLTVPPNSSVAFPIGTEIEVQTIGAGATTLVAGAGVSINTVSGLVSTVANQRGYLRKVATNTWYFDWLGSGGGATALTGLTDVVISSPANNQVLTYETASGKWKNKAGGGGGVRYRGDFFNPPLLTNFSVNTPAYGTPPTSSWTDTNGTTSPSLLGYASANLPDNADRQKFWLKSAPSGKKITARFRHGGPYYNNGGGGIAIFNSTSTKNYWIGLNMSTGIQVLVISWTGATFNASHATFNPNVFGYEMPEWYQIEWDATNIFFRIGNGTAWSTIFSTTLAAFISSIDQVGWCLFVNGRTMTWPATVLGPQMDMLYYSDSNVNSTDVSL